MIAAVILTVTMAVILVVVIALPGIGLWALLLLLASRPSSASSGPVGNADRAGAPGRGAPAGVTGPASVRSRQGRHQDAPVTGAARCSWTSDPGNCASP